MTIEELNDIFRQIFSNPDLVVTMDTTSDDIPEWDSFSHLNLIMAIEMKYGIKFALGETQTLKNVGEMLKLINKKIDSNRG